MRLSCFSRVAKFADYLAVAAFLAFALSAAPASAEPSSTQAGAEGGTPPSTQAVTSPSAASAPSDTTASQSQSPSPNAAEAAPDKPVAGKPVTDKPVTGEAPAGKPASGEPALGKSASGKSAPAKPGSEAAAKETEPAPVPGGSQILVNIDKSNQEMTVFVDGIEKYTWPVSTGKRGYSTPSGTYKPTSMNEIWYSKQWDNSPMPHSIFFMTDGHAIHGSHEVKNLGKPASHGCVRLSPPNAAILYDLVKKNGMENTQVVLTGTTPGGEAKVADQEQPDYPNYGAYPWPGQRGYGYYPPPQQYYQQQPRRRLFGGFFGAPQGYYRQPRGYYPRGY